MEKSSKMSRIKQILDCVHGYIEIPEEYCDHIVDTIQFQRLRRIEQTSIRSVFPCARHDRFMHSLGVFHIGCTIVNHLKESKKNEQKGYSEVSNNLFYTNEQRDDKVFTSYELACLLHDICHSPFSHTFEFYFDKMILRDRLINELNDKDFTHDWDEKHDISKEHEIMSAYMVFRVFKDWIETDTVADIKLIVRMIVGCKYLNDEMSFENAMIDLIHGDVDADGMDYACRDVWASGYSTNSIDLQRLIRAIYIVDINGKFYLSFDAKAKNEIEGFLNVKTFQYDYVFAHHTIMYEKQLLIESMESAALFHLDSVTNEKDQNKREDALHRLCNVEAFYSPKKLKSKFTLYMPMDDDFVSMMKFVPKDKYISQWLSRHYSYEPLWKTRAEWLSMFPAETSEEKLVREGWAVESNIKEILSANVKGINADDIITSKVQLANKIENIKDLWMKVGDHLYRFNELYKEEYPQFAPIYEKDKVFVKSDYVYVFVNNLTSVKKVACLAALKESYCQAKNNVSVT